MKITKGNLLDINKGIIIHQVNCKNVMGAGVAKSLYEKYPIIKTKYHEMCNKVSKSIELLGQWQIIDISNDLKIVNLFSQYDYGYGNKFTDEKLLINGINQICFLYYPKTVYIPYKIGCGLGGGNWNVIKNGISDNNNLIAIKLNTIN